MVPVTAKNVTIKVHSHVEQIKELTLATHDGQPDVIKADKNVNYEFFDHSIGRAPNHIIAKRKGKDLHVSFEREGQNDDLIIEGFFEDEDKALIGVAEDGHYYYYIPDTGEVADYVTQLQDADVEGQALGGEHHLTPLWLMLPTGTFPWWPLLGLGVIPFLGKDDDDKPAPTPDSVISTTNDSERGDGDNPVRVNVLKNDADNAVPETLRLIDPETGRPTTEKVVVSGQGAWELDSKEPGVVIFTPEEGYNGNPTPINYVVKNKESKESQPTPVFIIYDAQTTPDTKPGTPGQPVTQNVTSNDGDVDPSTVKLVDSNNPPSNEVKVPGKGTWTVGPKPGEVTFTPEDGFTGDPDPIKYVVKDKDGKDLPPTSVDVSYPQLTNPDTKPGTPGQPVTQNVTSNDGDVDPSTVKLVDPNNPNNPPSNEVKVPGKGTWTVGPKPGEVTFTPEDGFTGDPDPIKYVVKDKDGKDLPPTSVDVTYPEPTQPTPTNPDTKPGTPGQPVTQNVTSNDGDVNPSTVKLVDPNNPNNPPSNEVKVPGQGTWTVGPKPGEVTFTPEDGFTGDPDPIKYVVKDKGGNDLPPTDVDVSYPQLTNPDTKPGAPGQPVTQNVTNNDGDVDPSTVKLVDPKTGEPTDKIVVPNEGTWTVGPKPGEVTFTPEDGFTGNPGPVNYYINDKSGNQLQPTPVAVTYPSKPADNDKPAVSLTGLTNVNEGVGKVQYTVHLENVDNTKDTVVTVSLTNGKAVIGEDYKGDTYTVTIPKGKTTATFEVPIVNDDPAVYEGPEDYNVTITAINGQAVKTPADNQRVTTTIHDDGKGTPDGRDPNNPDNQDPNKPQDPTKPFDPSKPVDANNPDPRTPPKDKLPDADNDKPAVSLTGLTNVNEGVGKVQYTVHLENVDNTKDTVVTVSLTNGKAVIGEDYKGDTYTVTIPKGKTTATFEVPIVNDDPAVYEGPEDYNVTITAINGQAVKTPADNQRVTTTIHDDGKGTPDGRDPNNPDNQDPNKPQDPTKPFDPSKPVDANNPDPRTPPKDKLPDADNDKPAVSLTGLTNVNEGVGKVQYTVHLENVDNTKDTVVTVSLTNGKAVIGEDYKGDTYTVTIPKGKTTATFEVPIVNDDPAVYEGPEDYNVTITAINGQAVKTPADNQRVTTTIHDDGKGTPDGRDPNNPDNQDPNKPQDPTKPFDPSKPVDANNPDPRTPPKDKLPDADNDKPAVSLTGLTNVNEGVGKVQYTVHLENVDNTKDTVVTVSLTNGKAVIGEDYKGDTYTVTIPKGKTTATFEVPIVNDDPAVYEGPEDYNVTITAINGQAVKTPADNQRVTTTIHDDGKGTPDGRDPNNPDNQDPNKPQDPTKPFDPSKPVDANNPDPRTPPKDKLPDADNDKPAVSLTGLTNVNEGVGKVQYTVHLENVDNTKDTVVTVSLTNGKAVIGEDYKGDTYTVTIPKGKTTATFEVPIVNDDPAVYEGPEDYNVTITAINGQAVKTPADNQRVTTTIHDDGKGTPDGRDPNNPDNQDPNKPQDPTKPFDPSKPVDANNPDPRTPPKDKLPDADNDKPAVSLTGLTNVNEGVGKVQYTVHLENVDNTKDTVVTVSLTNGKAVIGEDYKGDTYTVTIPKGKTTATFEVPIVNDDPAVYEGPEDYNVTITAINGQAVKTPADNQRVTTTIHDDGKGTPDGRDPNNPDNQDPNKPQDPTKPFDPSKPVDANNPDPRTPPKDKLPDADNDKPVVSITGTTDTNENGKTADGKDVPTYTIAIDNGKGATAPIAVKFKVDTGNDTTYDPLTAEANDIDIANIKAFSVDSNGDRTLVALTKEGDSFKADIPGSKLEVEVPLVNDNVYEGAETYKVALEEAKIGDVDVKTTDANKQAVTTTIYDNGTTDGSTPVTPSPTDPTKPDPNDPEKAYDKLNIKIDPPARVTEESLPGGNPDMEPDGVDKTPADIGADGLVSKGRIYVEGVDVNDPAVLSSIKLKLKGLEANDNLTTGGIGAGKTPVVWTEVPGSEGKEWIGKAASNDQEVLKVRIVGNGSKSGDKVMFEYEATLIAHVNHLDDATKDNLDDLDVKFDIEVYQDKTKIADNQAAIVVVEDDAPIAEVVMHRIDVPVDEVNASNIVTGFVKDSWTMVLPGRIISRNYDGDDLIEHLNWNASYTLTNDDAQKVIANPLSKDGFELVTFTHYNTSSSIIPGSMKMKVQFTVNVNNQPTVIENIVNLTHLETYNGGTYSQDFMVLNLENKSYMIDGKAYQLVLEKDSTGTIAGSLSYISKIKTAASEYAPDPRLTNHFNKFLNEYEKTKIPVAEADKSELDINGDGFVDAIERGEMLILESPEGESNQFNLKAKLVPISTIPEFSNDLETSGKLKKGSEGPGYTEWETDEKDVTVEEAGDGIKVFTSKYGTFTAKPDGAYSFVAASDIDKQVDVNNKDENLVFSYIYTDEDGDTAKNDVIIKINGYDQYGKPRNDADDTSNGTEHNDSMKGTSGNDVLRSGKGDDTLEGLGGADILYGGEGNDFFLPSFDTNVGGNTLEDTIYGGTGFDTIVLNPQPYQSGVGKVDYNGNFDLSNFANKAFEIEAINMKNGEAQTLKVTASDILAISDSKTLAIVGDKTDKVDIDDSLKATNKTFKQSADNEGNVVYNEVTGADQENTYSLYESDNGAKLYVENGVQVI
ncbi:hypothetical protein LP108_09335 [Moraxella bovis]|uniref:Calx-beta domain-containing protein n=1 Tax=Moraxella bovis TaxID=476 RepID=UPI002226FCB0|nr:Calx-beta domain-containing protein [Moraxella bovis]UZA08029.1 hypothetical protein LP108_09335 [Moraxella bovis]